MPVAYTELRRTGPDMSEQGATAMRVLRIAGKDIEQFLQELFGATFIASMGFQMTKRAAHPHHAWLLAHGVRFEPFPPEDQPHAAFAVSEDDPVDGDTQVSIYADVDYAYEYVRAIVTYRGQHITGTWPEGKDPNQATKTYLTYQQQCTSEVMTLPKSGFLWETGRTALPPDVRAGIIIPTKTHTYDWHMVSDPPWSFIWWVNGKVNDSEVWGWPAETLLFDGCTVQREFDSEGVNVYWQLTYTILEKYMVEVLDPDDPEHVINVGWNHVYRTMPAGQQNTWDTWDKPIRAGTGTDADNPAKYMYETADFAELFRIGDFGGEAVVIESG